MLAVFPKGADVVAVSRGAFLLAQHDLFSSSEDQVSGKDVVGITGTYLIGDTFYMLRTSKM